MSEYRDDAVLTETMERVRRAELACVLYPPGTPEHTRAVVRLDKATRQMRRLAAANAAEDHPADGEPGAACTDPGPVGRR